MNGEVAIYALVDPRTNTILYVGQTIDLKRRIGQHLNARREWVAELAASALQPRIDVLETCSRDDANGVEAKWILACANPRLENAKPVDGDTLAQVKRLVDELGDKVAARRLGIGRATLSRLLAELPLAPGTMALVRENLDAALAGRAS